VSLAITILISAVVSLTLVPMMSARWLRQHDEVARTQPLCALVPAPVRQHDPPLRPLADWVLGARA
jgi:multidrug efflux pump subunit AcrB